MALPATVRRILLGLAVVVYLAYSSFGIAAPFWWGHHGYHGATYMLRARTSLRQHMLAPATWTGYDPPVSAALYFHHPIGYHHILTALIPVLGDKEWLARGVAALGGLFALWGLYVVGRRAWSADAGLLAVWTFVAMPVVCSFSILSDPMLLAFACVLWSLNAYLQILDGPKSRAATKRLLWHAVFACALGGFIMWEAYFVAPFLGAHALFYRFTERGRTLRLQLGSRTVSSLDAHTVVTGLACVVMMGFHVFFTWHAGALAESVESYKLRHAVPSAAYLLERHSTWLELLFGAPPVLIGVAWLALFLWRVLRGTTRRTDLVPFTFFYINTLYVYLFAEGSSVHLYRVFFFSGFFTFALVDLVVDAARAVRKMTHGHSLWIPVAVTALVGTYFFVETPRAYHNLIESRVLMGTHGQAAFNPEREKTLFAQEVHRRTTPDTRVILHYPHLGARKEFWYYIDRSLDEITELRQAQRYEKTWSKSVLIFDEHMLTEPERAFFRELIAKHPVTYFTRFAMIDLRESQPGAISYSFVDGPMSRSYRYFVSHKYPPLLLRRAAYLPGLCEAMDVGAPLAADIREEVLPPEPAATDLHMTQCYQHYLLRRGDAVGAEAAVSRLMAGQPAVELGLGRHQVLSVKHGPRAGLLTVLVRARGPEAGETVIDYLLTNPTSPTATQHVASTLPPPSRWQAGFVYVDSLVLPPTPMPPPPPVKLLPPAPVPLVPAPPKGPTKAPQPPVKPVALPAKPVAPVAVPVAAAPPNPIVDIELTRPAGTPKAPPSVVARTRLP